MKEPKRMIWPYIENTLKQSKILLLLEECFHEPFLLWIETPNEPALNFFSKSSKYATTSYISSILIWHYRSFDTKSKNETVNFRSTLR